MSKSLVTSIQYKEFKSFFKTNEKYAKWFAMFTNGKYQVSEITERKFTDDVKALFIAFFSLVNPHKTYSGRVDFIKQWYTEVPGRAQKLLKIYGSNSIIYNIRETSLREETWLRLLDCMCKVTLEEFNLTNLIYTELVEPTPIKQLKAEFIDYFTSGKGKNKKDDFNDFIGVDGYTQAVINGNQNYSQAVHDDFVKYSTKSKEPTFADVLNEYFRKNKEYKVELCTVLYKQFANTAVSTFPDLIRNPGKLNKTTRSRVLRVINECQKIYA